MFWYLDARVTPVLIPNTEVKPRSADDTLTGKVGRRQNKALDFFRTKNCRRDVPLYERCTPVLFFDYKKLSQVLRVGPNPTLTRSHSEHGS